MDIESLRREVDLLQQLAANSTFYELLGVPATADDAAIKTAFRNRARVLHADSWANTQLPADLRQRMERLMGELSRAQATLTNKNAREEYDAGLALAERGVPTDIRQIFGADEAFRSGRRLLDRGAFAEADEQFRIATTSNPSEPEYWAYRHWTEYCLASKNNTPDRATTERLRRNLNDIGVKHEKCAAAWLFLGHIERNSGNAGEATAAYKRVLALDRDNLDAQSSLRLMSRREEKKSGNFLTRLFKR